MKKNELTPQAATWAKNLKRLWLSKKSALGLTQEIAGDMMGMTQGAVGQYLNGIIPLNTDTKLKFAAVLKVDAKEIDPALPVASPNPDQETFITLPHLAWENAGAGGTEEATRLAVQWRLERNTGSRSFTLTVPGESMAAGPTPIVPGAIILVDPDVVLDSNLNRSQPFVVAQTGDGNIVLRQATKDGNKTYLKATATGFPIIPLDEHCRVIGVVRRITLEV